MNNCSLVLCFVAMLLAATVFAGMCSRLQHFQTLLARTDRIGSLDGLRGYLALAVFSHHFVFTYNWKSTGVWRNPAGLFFDNLGRVGVALFFMVSGFLFIGKVIQLGGISWKNFYISRIFRIMPLYCFVILLVLAVVLLDGGLVCKVPHSTFLGQILEWVTFSTATINNYHDSGKITAGVQWTLRYEAALYIFLPLVAAAIKGGRLASLQLVFILFTLYFRPVSILGLNSSLFVFFLVGGVTAYISKLFTSIKGRINHPIFSWFSIFLLLSALLYPVTLSFVHLITISLFFVPVALGNTIFGILSTKFSVFLGTVSYSIYLLHGLIIYVLFTLIPIRIDQVSLLSFALWMPIVGVLVVAISMIGFLSIEAPGIRLGAHITQWVSQKGA